MHRIVFLLLFLLTATLSVSAQPPTKAEMQKEMKEAVDNLKKEIAEKEKEITAAKVAKEEASVIKDLQDELESLKKQLKMLEGVGNSLAGMSEEIIQQASEEELVVPKKDLTRINSLPKKILTEAELSLFIKNVHAGVEKLIPAVERTEALKIYNETKATYKTTAIVANAASGCWMMGNWEKALFIMGKVCMDSLTDVDNLNNYAAFLIMAGAEQAGLPILEYLNQKYPNNSTLLNNIGQAWFGLGDMEKANTFLTTATGLYPNHSMANSSLSKVYESRGDSAKAVNFLKVSIKENYDPDKEAELSRLGYAIKYADMPEFNYPMKTDPLRLIPFIESIPEDYPTKIGDDKGVNDINSYKLGVSNLRDELILEDKKLSGQLEDRIVKLTDSAFREEFLEPHNCPAYKLAQRSYQLIWMEKMGNSSPLPIQLLLPFPVRKPLADVKRVKTVHEVWEECQDIWAKNVVEPTAALALAMKHSGSGMTCRDVDAATEEYLAKKNEIRKKGIRLIKQKFHEHAKELDMWVKIALYSVKDNPPKNLEELSIELISQLDYTTGRKIYRNNELAYMQNMAQNFVEEQAIIKSACSDQTPPKSDPKADYLAPLVVRNLSCEFKKAINTPVVVYSFQCNIMNEKPKGNTKLKKDPVNRGQGQSSKRTTTKGNGPLRGGKGPSVFDETGQPEENVNLSLAPLTAEERDPSQFSIEYDRWGNLVGLNVQLNNEGTALADPSSAETGMDSRWSWNAMASAKKGFLNKLLIK